jgi:S1-C subfamily serine protease
LYFAVLFVTGPVPAADTPSFKESGIYSDYLKQIGAEAANQVVGIDTRFTRRIWDVNQYRTIYTGVGFGSGFVYNTDGYIICDYSTVVDYPTVFVSVFKPSRDKLREAAYIRVNFYDGKQYSARLVGYDEATSIAVLKIDRLDPAFLHPVSFADSSQVSVGEPLAVLGYNYDTRSKVTVTSGIISALRTQYPTLEETENIFFQVNYPYNMGNAGGILVNLDGEMVAMITSGAPYLDILEVHFALPENVIRNAADQIIGVGEVHRPWFGFKLLDITDELKRAYEIPDVIEITYDQTLPEVVLRKVEKGELKTGKNTAGDDVILVGKETMGMFIISVEDDSPASNAGLAGEDILWIFEDKIINKIDILNNELEKYDIGDIVTLTYLRRFYDKYDVFTTEFKLTYSGEEEAG